MTDTPKRPGFVGRTLAKIRSLLDSPLVPESQPTSAVGVVEETLDYVAQMFVNISTKRLNIYLDAEEMDETVDEVTSALDILADNAVNSEQGAGQSFTVHYVDVPDALINNIEQMLVRTRWAEKAYSFARQTLKYGDCFVQFVFDKQFNIVRLMDMPASTMRRSEDEQGLLLNGSKQGEFAFEQYINAGMRFVAGFYSWQLEHMRWNRVGGSKYGTSLLFTARTAWKKLQAMEEALVINWLTRAFARLLFIIDTTGKGPLESQQAIADFKKTLKTRQVATDTKGTQQISVVKDIYIAKSYREEGGRVQEGLTDVKVLDTSNTGFWNLSAIEYYQNKIITSLKVPKAHLGIERDINAKATLQQQDRRFARTVRRIQSMLSQSIQHTINLQLLMWGFDPNSVEYKIVWPAPSWEDEQEKAATTKDYVDAAAVALKLGLVDHNYVRANWMNMSQKQLKELKGIENNIKSEPEIELELDSDNRK